MKPQYDSQPKKFHQVENFSKFMFLIQTSFWDIIWFDALSTRSRQICVIFFRSTALLVVHKAIEQTVKGITKAIVKLKATRKIV